MSVSTVVVAVNAQTLRRLDLRPEAMADEQPDRAAQTSAQSRRKTAPERART
jgi:hypothetical protein